METNTKHTIPISASDKKIEYGAYMVLSFLWVLTFITYYYLPDTIPIHYNASGVPDNFGKKTTIIMLPIIGTMLFGLLTYLNKHPRFFNNPTVLNGENTEHEYTYVTRLIRFYKLAIVTIFSLIVLFTYLTAIGKTKGLGVWFLPFIICIMIIPNIFFIFTALKAK